MRTTSPSTTAPRALGRLARTFPAQIDALNRYRSHGEPAITVQNVKVEDGGNAIVGNVTQHASVIVSDKNPAAAAGRRRAEGSKRRASPRRQGKHRHERSRPQYRPDAGEPAMRREDPFRRRCRSPAVRGKRRCRMHGGAPGSGAPRENRNARKHGLFTGEAIAERKQIQALLADARKLLQGMKCLRTSGIPGQHSFPSRLAILALTS